jgi:hypothetical protein
MMMMAMTIYFRLRKLVQKVYFKQWHESLMDSIATLLMRTFANVHCFGGASMSRGTQWWECWLNKSLALVNQIEIKQIFSIARILIALWSCCLQIDHLN